MSFCILSICNKGKSWWQNCTFCRSFNELALNKDGISRRILLPLAVQVGSSSLHLTNQGGFVAGLSSSKEAKAPRWLLRSRFVAITEEFGVMLICEKDPYPPSYCLQEIFITVCVNYRYVFKMLYTVQVWMETRGC
uniref:Uncharacterized protein n=1 Tax=Helianthus annuus TaxID=4232 RepID=A0A251SY06_HELAN